MRIVVIGSTGQLGTDLMEVLRVKHEVKGLSHHDIEVRDRGSWNLPILRAWRPDVIINTAGYSRTVQAEEEAEEAFSINAIGARNIADLAHKLDAVNIFISSDYVFGKTFFPSEEDIPDPMNTYGVSKLAGECFTKQYPKHYIIRSSALFGVAGSSGKGGGNFVETMIAKAEKKEPLKVTSLIWTSPTYAKDAASIIEQIIRLKLPYGVYHVTNRGCCTWFEFAEAIFKLLSLHPILESVETEDFQIRRPRFACLSSYKLNKHQIKRRIWRDALKAYLIEKGHLK